MAGIVSATQAQCETLRVNLEKTLADFQRFSQGDYQPTKLNAAQIARIDAAVDALVAAIAPVNT